MEDFWELSIPPNHECLVIPWRPEAQGLPILRNATMAKGVTKDPLSQSTFETIFKDIVKLSGYFGDATIHAIRRDLGKKLDGELTSSVSGAMSNYG